MTLTPDLFVHLANVVFLASYSVRDMLWLRILSLVAGGLLMVFYLAEGLWAPIGWNVVFSLVHTYHIVRLFLERRPINLTADEQQIYNLAFRSLTPRELRKLVAIGEWKECDGDCSLVEPGQQMTHLMVLFDGRARVEVDANAIAELRAGSFVGEMSFLTGEAPSAGVISNEPSRYLAWSKELEAFLENHPSIRTALQQILGADLARKLRTA